MTGNVSRVIAGCFSLAAFATAIVAGLAGGNHASAVLVRATIAMFVCYPLGLIVGGICQRIVNEYVQSHRQADPEGKSPPGGQSSPASDAAETGQAEESVLEV